MDILTIAGILIGIAALLSGQILEGGSIYSILQPTAAIIVFGGTLGAVLISHPLGTFVQAVKDLRKAFFNSGPTAASMISYISALSVQSNTHGLLTLEDKLKDINMPFFVKGLQLVIDGEEPDSGFPWRKR